MDSYEMIKTGFSVLLRLVKNGTNVKASGFGRVNLNLSEALKSIANINPTALIFGTDLPDIWARRPFETDNLILILDTLGDTLTRQVFYDKAVKSYKPYNNNIN